MTFLIDENSSKKLIMGKHVCITFIQYLNIKIP